MLSPDYADNTKFAEEWLPARPGTDWALAMAMGQVILKEFFVDKTTPRFTDYVNRFTDLPFLVTLTGHVDGFVPGKFLSAADIGESGEGVESRTVPAVGFHADSTSICAASTGAPTPDSSPSQSSPVTMCRSALSHGSCRMREARTKGGTTTKRR